MCGKADRDDSTGGRQTRCYQKKPYAMLEVPTRPARALRYWTAQPAVPYRLLDHGNHVSKSPWEPTVNGPPITPGTLLSRFDLTKISHLSVSPSQHAIALLRLPACYDIRRMAHDTLVKMLGTTLIISLVSTSGNQRSTDVSVRLGLAGLSASALQGVPCACPATSQPMADGPSRDPR
jgi:hypothetical protein